MQSTVIIGFLGSVLHPVIRTVFSVFVIDLINTLVWQLDGGWAKPLALVGIELLGIHNQQMNVFATALFDYCGLKLRKVPRSCPCAKK